MGTQATDIPTREEHAARAMLLGRWYDRLDGTYCLDDAYTGCDMSVGMLDCVTLEPTEYAVARRRQEEYYDKPKPWAREE